MFVQIGGEVLKIERREDNGYEERGVLVSSRLPLIKEPDWTRLNSFQLKK
jgi:hypothetical protein